MNMRRRFIAGAAVAGILLPVAACSSVDQAVVGQAGTEPAAEPRPSTMPAPARGSIKSTGPDAGTLDRVDADLGPFLERFALSESAYGLPSPASIDEAVEESTVVMIAKVKSVVDESKFQTEPGSSDNIQQMGIVLQPIKVLKGELQPGLDEVVIQQWGSPGGVKSLAAAGPPSGVGIFFLRWAGAYPHPDVPDDEPTEYERAHYIWTHFNTVFVQGKENAVAPMASEADATGRHGMTNAAQSAAYAKLSGLAERIRTSNSKAEQVS